MAAPDPVLQFFLSTFYKKAIDPTSQYYLPTLVKSQTGPVVEPYVIDGSWNNLQLGQQGVEGAQSICLNTSSGDDPGIPAGNPPATPVLNLVDPSYVQFPQKVPLQIAGLSNVLASVPIVTDGDNITATATFGVIPTWPIPCISFQGNFSVEQACCTSQDGAHCTPGTLYSPHGEGTFTATLTKAQATAKGSASVSPDGSTLTVTISDIALTAAPGDLTISVVIYTVDNPKWRAMWSKYAETIFNYDDTKESIIAQMSNTLNGANIRSSFENVINNALANLFGG
jgi:hypothetical protein